jgi:erythromycin esterase
MFRRLVVAALTITLAFPLSAARRRAVAPPRVDLPAVEWLRASAAPFATTAARSGLDDLAPLSPIVGDARIVSLGEATHGSAEFFTMKHRILEYLVERKGFTVFAIEANLPEADAVDDYVVHGRGNAASALRGMYFWTWDTAEVLDMIEWMREYNLRRGEKPAVRFRGFDAQYAHGGVPRLDAYVKRVDPDRAASFSALYDCIRIISRPSSYSSFPAATKNACAASIADGFNTLSARRAEYVQRSSATEFANHLRYARVVVQAEATWAGRGNRDHFMAENVEWMAGVAHPGEKLVLWAHNAHVAADSPFRMGTALRQRFGRGMVIVGFDFDRGGFTSNGPAGLGPQSVSQGPADGWEAFFRQAARPRFILDLRSPWSAHAAAYVRQPQRLWTIGSIWDPDNIATRHRWTVAVATAFDVMIYIETTTASKLNRR